MLRRRNIISFVMLLVLVVGGGLIAITFLLQGDPIPLGAPSGELAFTSNQDGQWDIMLMDTEGAIINLTDDGSGKHDYFPSWSFDDKMVNFITNRDDALGPGQVTPQGEELRTLSITEGIMTVFREGRFDWDPAWSPDGEELLWASLRDMNLEVYVSPADDLESRTRITSDRMLGPRDWFHSWSPDGQYIVFGSDRDGNENIYRINADGTDLIQLTDDPEDDFHPMWSQDGQSIAFVSERNTSLAAGVIDLFVMDIDGSNQRLLGEDEVWVGDLIFSADGQEVVYVSNEEGNWNLYTMDANGENITRITESNADDLFPVWRPIPLEEN